MSDILLTKSKLPEGFLDVSVGEAHIVRDNLFQVFDCSCYTLPKVQHMYEYPDPQGYNPLVRLLEEKHKAPVIITNGAKQALAACMYMVKKLGGQTIGLPCPWWCLLPPLIEASGLKATTSYQQSDAALVVVPNNPDGYLPSLDELKSLEQECKDKNITFIHDAVYYNNIYLPTDYPAATLGDIQIYSLSKSLGLSGCRTGYIVCRDTTKYNVLREYVEMMTVGVSILSQIFLYDLLDRMRSYPTLTSRFEWLSYSDLQKSKEIFSTVNPEVVEVPLDFVKTPGMFAFVKCPMDVLTKAKINAVDGFYFGMPGYVRINLAFPEATMQEIVKRLNATKES